MLRVKIWPPNIVTATVLKLVQFAFKMLHPKDADGMANSVDPEQSHLDLQWFAQTYHSSVFRIFIVLVAMTKETTFQCTYFRQ